MMDKQIMKSNKTKYWIQGIFMMVFVMLFTLSIKETAHATQVEIEGYTIDLDESSKIGSIAGYTGTDTNLYIPSTINYNNESYSIYKINASAFANRSDIVSVEIPESVSQIATKAFQECSSLTTVNIPEGISVINAYTFDGCSSLVNITIPESVVNIGNYAFSDCSSLTTVQIPNSVTVLGTSAYSGCTSLENLTISNKISSISSSAFYSCKNLTTVVIPDSVTQIAYQAFMYCGNLEHVTLPSGLTTIGEKAFCYCHKLEQINIPNTVTTIGVSAFYNSGLTSVSIPSSITQIRKKAFSGCLNLTSIEIPNTVTEIEESALSNTGLTSITIPNSVTIIGKMALSNCDNLNNIIFPSSISSLGSNTLDNCDNLSEMYYSNELSSSDLGLNSGGNNRTSIISYSINDDDTVSLVIENIANTATNLALPKTLEGRNVTAVSCLSGVRKLEVSSQKPSENISANCSCETVSDIELPENWKWKDADKDKDITGDSVVTATAFYDVLEREIYSDAEITVIISRQHIGQTDIKEAKESNCKESGYTGDIWCLTCNEKIADGSSIPVTNTHTYDVGVVTTPATFADTGIKTFTCTICENNTKTEEIPILITPSRTIEITCFDGKVIDLILPANWQWKLEDQDKEWGTVASFTAVAVYEGDDKVNYSTTEVDVNITVEHTGETIIKDKKEASCKEAGYTGDTWCLECNKIIVEGETIEKVSAHTYNDGVITKSPTVEEQGIKTYICTVCQNTKIENLPKLQAPPSQEVKEENTTDNNIGNHIVIETVPKEEKSKQQEHVIFKEETNKESKPTEDGAVDGDESVEKEFNDKIDDESVIGIDNKNDNGTDEKSEKDFNVGVLFVVIPVVALFGAGGVFIAFKFKKLR